ncbi:hypothetical protein SDC9_200881 [bioreactor metagenome]|uniref:Uncharacterized protein n=1 Tax=bioreactor metagenome TaxID=1076179 RepID=A0A645IPQ1_9ZZZZ
MRVVYRHIIVKHFGRRRGFYILCADAVFDNHGDSGQPARLFSGRAFLIHSLRLLHRGFGRDRNQRVNPGFGLLDPFQTAFGQFRRRDFFFIKQVQSLRDGKFVQLHVFSLLHDLRHDEIPVFLLGRVAQELFPAHPLRRFVFAVYVLLFQYIGGGLYVFGIQFV